jgi:tripartite-type tricarboxylate transporter receptor subunit TctC
MKRITTLALLWSAGLQCTMGAALAQSAPWPQRAIKIVTPTPPGVGSDIFACSYADQLSRLLRCP